jgi:hypothetical protein
MATGIGTSRGVRDMSKENKKKSLRIGLALLTGVVLIAVANSRAFNDYCSKIVFTENSY